METETIITPDSSNPTVTHCGKWYHGPELDRLIFLIKSNDKTADGRNITSTNLAKKLEMAHTWTRGISVKTVRRIRAGEPASKKINFTKLEKIKKILEENDKFIREDLPDAIESCEESIIILLETCNAVNDLVRHHEGNFLKEMLPVRNSDIFNHIEKLTELLTNQSCAGILTGTILEVGKK